MGHNISDGVGGLTQYLGLCYNRPTNEKNEKFGGENVYTYRKKRRKS